MNKLGQNTLFLSIIVGVAFFIFGMLIGNFIKPTVADTRNVTLSNGEAGLDCTNSSISDGNKATCLVVDISYPIYVYGIVSGLFAFIFARLLL